MPVTWLSTVPLDKAVQEVAMLRNQNTVCRQTTPGWRHTVEQLKQRFPGYGDEPAAAQGPGVA